MEKTSAPPQECRIKGGGFHIIFEEIDDHTHDHGRVHIVPHESAYGQQKRAILTDDLPLIPQGPGTPGVLSCEQRVAGIIIFFGRKKGDIHEDGRKRSQYQSGKEEPLFFSGKQSHNL